MNFIMALFLPYLIYSLGISKENNMSVNAHHNNDEIDHIWITRCPVPTATGIALKRGTLEKKFALKKIGLSTLQDADKQFAAHHVDHELSTLFREGGNVPALVAKGDKAPSKLIGLTWIDEWQVIIVRQDSDIQAPQDLKGKRVALPAYAQDRARSIFRAMSLQGIRGALKSVQLDLDDVSFVDIPLHVASESSPPNTHALSSSWTGLDALVAGTVDAVYVKGASAVDAATARGLKVGIHLDQLADIKFRVNNGTPRPITVHQDLIENHFDLVVDFLEELLDTADWASHHLNDVLHILESETKSGQQGVNTAYGNGFHTKLHPTLDEDRISLIKQQKNFLWLHGFLNHDVDIDEWIDHRPLQAALERRKKKVS